MPVVALGGLVDYNEPPLRGPRVIDMNQIPVEMLAKYERRAKLMQPRPKLVRFEHRDLWFDGEWAE